MSNLTNCGLPFPGQTPTGPGSGNTVPAEYIPNGTTTTVPPFNNSPPRPQERRWWCGRVLGSTCVSPPPTREITDANCIECTNVGGTWLPSDRDCSHTSIESCIASCKTERCVSQQVPPVGTPPSSGGGGGDGSPGDFGSGSPAGGGGVGGPITPRWKWKCRQVNIPCPNLPNKSKGTRATCIRCGEEDILRYERGIPIFKPNSGCEFDSEFQCIQSANRLNGARCVNTNTPENCLETATTPRRPPLVALPTRGDEVIQTQTGIGTVIPNEPNRNPTSVLTGIAGSVPEQPTQIPGSRVPEVNPFTEQLQRNNASKSTNLPPLNNSTQRLSNTATQTSVNTRDSLNSIVLNTSKKSQKVIGNPGSEVFRYSNVSSSFNTEVGLLDPVYNFFNLTANENTKLVENIYNRNIFNNVVSQEVYFFLKNKNTRDPWSESNFFNLTLNKIAVSLNEGLMAALNSIHLANGQIASVEQFINGIRFLLITGRIDEFDPTYYINLANEQKDFERVTFSQSMGHEEAKQAAIGLISLGFSSVDFRKYVDRYISNQIKRSRRLNTDLEAKVKVIESGDVSSYVNLYDAGIKTYELDKADYDYLELGDGAGYYFSAVDISSNCSPLITENEVEIAYFVPPEVRYTALSLLDLNPGLTLLVNSSGNYNELSENYNHARSIPTMYFALDLESIEVLPTDDSLISKTQVRYKLLTEEEIEEHSKNYGLDISKVNININDPFIHYAMDTSSFTAIQHDITFHGFSENRTNVGERIITRNIPFGLILTPGMGSNHNPFFANSNIVSFTTSSVTRQLNVIPSFKKFNNIQKLLDEQKLYLVSGGLSYVGEYEKQYYQDTENVIYKYNNNNSFFRKSYYINGQYSNVEPPSSVRIKSPEATVLSKIDYLVSSYNVEFLTWWDIYRRMPLNEIGSLFTTPYSGFNNSLSNGWRGIEIKDVPARPDKITSGINEELVDGDVIIIYEENRLNA